MWANQHERGVELLQRYLALPSSTWTRGTIGGDALPGAHAAREKDVVVGQGPNGSAAPAGDLARFGRRAARQADWLNLFWACTNGIEKTHRTGSYLDDAHCWGFRLFDLGAIAAWHLNVMDRAVEWGQKALELDPAISGSRTISIFSSGGGKRFGREHERSVHCTSRAAVYDVRHRALCRCRLRRTAAWPVESSPANAVFRCGLKLGRRHTAGLADPRFGRLARADRLPGGPLSSRFASRQCHDVGYADRIRVDSARTGIDHIQGW